MKKIMLIFSLMLLLVITGLVYAEGEKIEYCEEKVILEGRWGTGEGEFGIYREPIEGYSPYGKEMRRAPLCLRVKGDYIYILDGENFRVQKFTMKGKYVSLMKTSFRVSRMSVDDDGEVFTYSGDNDVNNGGRIERFSSKGESIQELKAIIGETYIGDGVYSNNGYLYSKYNGVKIGKLDNKPKIEKKIPRFGKEIMEIGYQIKNNNIDKIRNTITYRYCDVFTMDKDDLYVVFSYGDKYNLDYTIGILDSNGDILKMVNAHGKYYQFVGEIHDRYLYMDENGNIYQLWTNEEGVYVSLWERK